MKRIAQMFAVGLLILCIGNPAFANMKKSKVGGGGTKGFVFSTFSDGFCTLSTVYDKSTSYLGVAIGLGSTGDLVCAGLSTQSNYQSCTAGLPAGTYIFVVVSLSGASPFRVVVNCSDQQNVNSTGTTSQRGIDIQEIELGTAGNHLLDQFNDLAERSGRLQ